MLSRVTLHNKLKPYIGKFHAIGNSTRLSIIYLLSKEPLEFKRLASRLKLPPSLLSHHIKQLLNTGLVTKTKVGNLTTYYLSEDAVKEMSALLRKFVSPQPESN